MPYCPKCGNQVEENMTFCPRCGAPLKKEAGVFATPVQAQRTEKAEKGEKQEKNEPEKGEKQEKGEFGFLGFLIGGLILIVIGVVAYANAMGWVTGPLTGSVMLLIIGVVIIIIGVYAAMTARRRSPQIV
jgi:hypothetical protein